MTSSRRSPWKLGLGLAVLLALQACEDVSVTAVDVASVGITPSQGELVPGDTLRLQATLRDASGTPLPGRTVSWSSDDPAVASVDASGRVQAETVGDTRIRAGSGSVEGSIVVTVRQPPDIVLSESQVQFDALVGQGPTAPRAVQITNGGGAPLSGLSVQVDSPSGGGASWLEATLDGTQAPATLTLRASAASLSAGTYHAVVLVSSAAAGNSPQTLPVAFSVGTQPASIQLSSTLLGFAWEAGQDVPPPQSVSITNAGGGQLTGLGTSIRHATGEPTGWLSIQLSSTSAPATLTLSVSPGGLATGVYSAFVEVTSPGAANSPQELRVRLTAGSPPPEIELSPAGVSWTVTEDQDLPAQRQIDVTNRGTGNLAGLSASLSYAAGQPTGWLNANLTGSVAPSALALTLTTTELLPGNYAATVAVASGDAVNSPQTASVQLEVLPRIAPELSTITADPDTLVANGVSTSLVTVLLRDPRGDPYPFGGANVQLATTAGTLGAVTGGQGGTYTAVLTAPSEAGEAVISGTVDGAAIGDSAKVTFVAEPERVSGSLSTATASPDSGVVADGASASTVSLQIRAPDGSNVTGLANEDFTISLSGSAQAGPVTPGSAPGAYSFAVTNTVAESVTVTITVAGVTLDATPTIRFVAGPVSAETSSATASPATGVTADGTTASRVTVELRDANRNRVTGLANSDFSIGLTGAASRSPVSETPTAGTYTFDVTNTTAETVTVTITAGGITLDDRPTIQFTSDSVPVSASLSTATASPDTAVVANGTAAFTISVRVRDPDGDWVRGLQNEDFSIALTGSAQAGPVISRPPPGAHEFRVTNTVAEVVTVTITVLGVTLDDRPTLEFRAGPVSAGVSSVSASPSTGVIADESDASTVTIEVRDANGNPIGGLDDGDFSIDLSGDGEEGSVSETDIPGTYAFSVTNSTAETVEVRVEVDDVTLDDRPTIEFVAGTVAGDKSSAWPDPSSGLVADGVDASIVTVELRDRNDNPIGGLDDDRFAIRLIGDATRTAVIQTDTLGTYTFAVTNTTAEKVEVTIIVDGVTIEDRPEIQFDGETDSRVTLRRLPPASESLHEESGGRRHS